MNENLRPYMGREQTYIKHLFLTKYLEAAAFKIFQRRSETINFIDAFAGPWKVQDKRDYSDASFAQAVRTLENVRVYLENMGIKDRNLNSYFCEKNANRVRHLNRYKDSHPNLNIQIFSGKFEDNLNQILCNCRSGFTFTFIDPTGWSIDSKPIFEFLGKLEGELIMNFMADPINRHVTNPNVEQSFCRFLAESNWKEKFEGSKCESSNEEKILYLLKQKIRSTRVAKFVPDFPIENPTQRRIKMRLLLGTNSQKGIEVFRDIQKKVESDAIEMKEIIREKSTNQPSLFTYNEIIALENGQSGVGCTKYKTEAISKIKMILVHSGGKCKYYKIIRDVLESIPIKRSELNKLVKLMENSNSIECSHPSGKYNLGDETTIKYNDRPSLLE